jgi:hypothetical protein
MCDWSLSTHKSMHSIWPLNGCDKPPIDIGEQGGHVGGRVGENKLDGDALHMKIYPDFRPRDLCMCINIQCIRWDYHYYILQRKFCLYVPIYSDRLWVIKVKHFSRIRHHEGLDREPMWQLNNTSFFFLFLQKCFFFLFIWCGRW